MFNPQKRFAMVAIAAAVLFSSGLNAAPLKKVNIVARVGSAAITATDLRILAQERGISKPTGQQRKKLIDSLVDWQLLTQQAVTKGLDKAQNVQALIASARDKILAREAGKHYIAQHPVSEEQLHARYNKQVVDLPHKQYKLRVIVTATQSKARAIEKQLQHGGRFAQIADKQSTLSAKKMPGGNLGWVFAKNFIPPIAKAIRTTPKKHAGAPVWTRAAGGSCGLRMFEPPNTARSPMQRKRSASR